MKKVYIMFLTSEKMMVFGYTTLQDTDLIYQNEILGEGGFGIYRWMLPFRTLPLPTIRWEAE